MVLAAGGSSRFTGATHKLLAPFRGRPLVCWAVEAALASGVGETAVVVGGVDLGPVLPAGVTKIPNPDWASGQASSLQAARRWAGERGLDAFVVGLADQPLVPASAWAAVAGTSGDLVVATFAGARRPPVKLGRAVWGLLPVSGDEGARVVMGRRPELVVEVACDGQPVDVDTVEDLERWS